MQNITNVSKAFFYFAIYGLEFKNPRFRRINLIIVRPHDLSTMLVQNPVHRSFFKYAAPDTALEVLRSKSVRYSSPLRFNDPFDVQSGLHFDFNIDDLHGNLIDKLAELSAAAIEPNIDREDPWGKIVMLCREYFPTHGFPKDRWRETTASVFAQLIDEIRDIQAKYQKHWEYMLPGMRVFCVSEERDNLLMWAHYAKDHTGVVFEFLSLPELENPLSVARKVEYVSSPPPFFSESEWLENILSLSRFDIETLNRRYVYYKSYHWRYEKEWRVWYPLTPTPMNDYTDNPINEAEFPAMYVGCKASDAFFEHAVTLARQSSPHLRIYRARRRQYDYGLEYIEV